MYTGSHIQIWELDHNCFWIVILNKTLESPLDCKEINPVNPKENQPWIFIGRTDAPILWLPDAKNWLTEKDPDDVKDWSQEEKGATEYEMVGGHHQLNGHEFEQTPGDSEGQLCVIRRVAKSWTWLGNWTTTVRIQRAPLSRTTPSCCPFRVKFSPSPTSGNHWFVFHLNTLAFSRMSYKGLRQ